MSVPASDRRRRRRALGLLIALLATLGCLVALEVAIRLVGNYDADGNFYLRYNRLRPYHLPVHKAEELSALASGDQAKILYDPKLGWRKPPDGVHHSVLGMALDPKAPVEPAVEPRPGVLRIALFGDSFTESTSGFETSWGNRLHLELTAKGVTNEVLNFGCDGYGMDQAFLRWQLEGRPFHPHVVIFGLQPENMARNLNLVRLMYQYFSGMPFTKPRFVLQPDGGLKLVNSPPALPSEVPGILRNPEGWDLIQYEYYYRPEENPTRFWHFSKLASYIELVVSDIPRHSRFLLEGYEPQSEAGRLGSAIIDRFAEDVSAANGTFLVLSLPPPAVIADLDRGQPLPHAAFLKEVEVHHPVIRPEAALLEEHRKLGLEGMMALGHYTAAGDRVLGTVVAGYVEKLLQEGKVARP